MGNLAGSLMRVMRACFCLLWTVAVGLPVAPDGTAVGPVTTVGTDEVFLQTAAQRVLGSFEPHKEYNYTCDQCYRMTYSLQDMCQATGGVSVDYVNRFQHECEEATAPVGNGDGPSRRWYKCGAFYQFVKELYCPYDPCVQVSIQSYKSHRAICGLLRCSGNEEGLPEKDGYETPLAFPAYVQAVLDLCKEDPSKEPKDLCGDAGHSQSFTREGCELVVERMEKTVAPLRLCDAWTCDTPKGSLEDMCENILKLNGTAPVDVPAWKFWMSQKESATREPLPIPMEDMGINISRATLGYGENCVQDHTNNILLRSRAQCQGLRKCKWDNPNMVNPKVLRDAEPECEGDFAIEYTCVPGGKKHSIFGPHTATYLQVPIDCSVEVAQAIEHPLPLKTLVDYNPAPQEEFNIYEGTRRRENSFMTPELQAQKDASTRRMTGDMTQPVEHVSALKSAVSAQ